MLLNNKPEQRGEYFDHKALEDSLADLQIKYNFIKVTSLTQSILGKSIPLVTLGKGKKSIIYVGAHHGMEWITSAILTEFLKDFCEEYKHGNHKYDISARVLFETRKIHIIPMLNPDGVEYCIHGINSSNVLYDRLIKMNNRKNDFSDWQANARGVDLNHNYNAGFQEYKIIERNESISPGPTKHSGEYSESEPETRAICNFIRFEQPDMAITLHTQGEEIYYTSGEQSTLVSLPIVKTLARLTGYKISFPTGTAKYGGFTDWFIDEFNKPSFTMECGLGKNPLPFTDLDKIYAQIKRALFTAPILI